MSSATIITIISPGENSIWGLFRNLNSEGESVSNPDSFHLLLSSIKDSDSWSWCFRGRGDANHIRVSYRHHAEGDILAAGVIGTSYLRYHD